MQPYQWHTLATRAWPNQGPNPKPNRYEPKALAMFCRSWDLLPPPDWSICCRITRHCTWSLVTCWRFCLCITQTCHWTHWLFPLSCLPASKIDTRAQWHQVIQLSRIGCKSVILKHILRLIMLARITSPSVELNTSGPSFPVQRRQLIEQRGNTIPICGQPDPARHRIIGLKGLSIFLNSGSWWLS